MSNGIALGNGGGSLFNFIDSRRLVIDVRPNKLEESLDQYTKRTRGETDKLKPIAGRVDKGGQDTAREGRAEISDATRALERTSSAHPNAERTTTEEQLRTAGSVNNATNRVGNSARDPDIRSGRPDFNSLNVTWSHHNRGIRDQVRNAPSDRDLQR